MDTLVNLTRKINSAGQLTSVVKTMKAIAASRIGQYETAAASLKEYFHTVELGLEACFKAGYAFSSPFLMQVKGKQVTGAIVFGSDQGLIGQFNDTLALFTAKLLNESSGEKKIWVLGNRLQNSLTAAGLPAVKTFPVPASVKGITSLVGIILISLEKAMETQAFKNFYIIHNQLKPGGGYEPVCQSLLPLGSEWHKQFKASKWPTAFRPEVLGNQQSTIRALIREYLFVSFYSACAESLASEYSSRLDAMRRAEKNINELTEELSSSYHRLRQSEIDEELFDVVSGFEAIKKTPHSF
jgi:F-type H+-transporting ATPase subunit gamma